MGKNSILIVDDDLILLKTAEEILSSIYTVSVAKSGQDHMFVARRTCGYIGTQFWNQGRTQEIKDRVLHL